MAHKIPVSVLVVMYSADGDFLLIERADKAGYWQSVTGSLDAVDEAPMLAAVRELHEETGLAAQPDATCTVQHATAAELVQPGFVRAWPHSEQYEIFEHWRHRYGPGVTHNTEHWFAVCLPAGTQPVLAPREHTAWRWCSAAEAAGLCFSPNNARAILALAELLATTHRQ